MWSQERYFEFGHASVKNLHKRMHVRTSSKGKSQLGMQNFALATKIVIRVK